MTATRLIRGAAAVASALLVTAASAASASPYSQAPYMIENHSYTFGQAPAFMPDGRVVVGKDFKDGLGTQIYLSNFDGTARTCLTCDMPAPNNVPNVRPQGDWIQFHSWDGHKLTIGSPGYGGMGSALWVMRPDGTQKTRLTGLDAARGAGEGEDDYHAYWSPDGKRLVWAHLNWNFATNGGDGKWDVRVADFVDDGVNPPHLANERVVRPANGHWYETQWWAPDGSGFLYTETAGSAMNTELFFCKLTEAGCEVRHLTDFNVGWDEQAIFTPDGKDVIFMSSRDHPGFYNSFITFTQAANLPTGLDYLLVLPVFYAAFLQPVAQEATDLYDLDLETGAVRRLTTSGDDGWIVPEFTWDPDNEFLFWTEQRIVDRERVPLPLKPLEQVQRALALAQDPPLPDAGLDNLLSAAIKLEARTRIMRFDLP